MRAAAGYATSSGEKMPSRNLRILSLTEDDANALANYIKCCANDCRLKILCMLIESEYCVSDIAVLIGLSNSATSQHLARLRSMNLVQTRRSSQIVYYSCSDPGTIQFLALLQDLV